MSAPGPDPDDDGFDITAGEYVLGVLPLDAHAAAARRVAADPVFAAEVETWEARLTPLFAEIAAIEPPERVWAILAGRIAGTVVPIRRPPSTWDNLPLWRGMAAVSAAVAAACLVVLVLPRPVPPPVIVQAPVQPAAVSVAQLAAPKGAGGASFVATLDQTGGRLIVTPVAAAPDGRSHELWLMPAKAAPIPLGVFMGKASLVIAAPAALKADSLLGVSLEPAGGSPTGAPTGPVVAVGQLMRL